ncbi:hypothetical protein ACFWMQ_16000 [Streptomyces sp. NPDC058372]|uniref:hypothetical protein n=1 Tax=Streptomyces sp. NPDC058372 TaxID=3346464 RepID=UPI0036622CFF
MLPIMPEPNTPQGLEPLSAERLAEIAARAEAATAGPWCTDGAEIYQGDEYTWNARDDEIGDWSAKNAALRAELAARPQVWLLMQGEDHEGGNVLGVFATRDTARGEFIAAGESR